MERLLKDAEALTEKKYDINNLADVYNAIHAIQDNLGIAGTTAKEAEKTISGSAAMTAAAWKNVLIAISSEGDLDKAINNLVFSVSRYFENIVPVVQRSIAGIGDLIEGVAPLLVQTVAQALIEAIPSLINALYQMVIGLAKGIYQGIVALFTGKKAAGAMSAQMSGVAASTNDAAQAEENLADGITSAGKAAKKYLAGFDEITKLNDSAGGGGSAEGGGFGGGGGGFSAADDQMQAEGVLSPIMEGISDKLLELIAPLKDIDFSKSIDSAKNLGGALFEIGKTIADHLEWYWFNVLVPMAEWSIEELLPTGIDALAAAFDLLNVVIKPVAEGLHEFFDYVKPIYTYIEDNVIFCFGAWIDAIQTLSNKLKEKNPGIKRIISGLGSIVSKLWKIVEPALISMRNIWGQVFSHMAEVCSEKIGILIDILEGIIVFVDSTLSGDWETAWSGIKQIFSAFVDDLFLRADGIIGYITPIFGDIEFSARDAFMGIVSACAESWTKVKEFFAPAVEWFSNLFGSVKSTIDDAFYNIGVIAEGSWSVVREAWSIADSWFDKNVAGPVSKKVEGAWSHLADKAADAWTRIKAIFAPVGKFFENTFVGGFKNAFKAFSANGDLFTDIKDGIAQVFKGTVNQLIRGINNMLSVPFRNINNLIIRLKGTRIVGLQPFKNLSTISIPQIPYLAQGAVLPPNKPFMAMVGDQRHGTNIEAPLATIEEAVANVMEDWVQSNAAGQEVMIAVLRDILQAVLGINIGDDEIGQAVARYNAKMAIIKGGSW